ncbi:uncharacterized protein Z518_06042 [Rhinocladiella mackenziei CBS 650.93]|uniref:Zn(2)-C6 fungal-type domain-containing protein n=1 Tax=Rhinocladiella mackenziei CBS 650.93 TaxID=1442369 RepID=A0A0D2J7Z6_9EURO|nr:uncharacterized protein Z518_06042 [Rhinocladiella mackenziei CBS 650.93]KIX05170.1 hypothetical protein Z518_06042 [Rhinocladiella mackenziei CBS 650.93]
MAGPPEKGSESSGRARKKRWHHKNFSGCIKCKQRHVKCDERKPSCERCLKLGITCPGYRLPKVRIFQIEAGPQFKSNEERANYDYFVRSGSKILSLYQISSLPFWTRLAPQLAETNAAVKNGLVALGALLRPFHHQSAEVLATRKETSLGISPLVFHHLTEAVNHLRMADPGSLSAETSITCCILFSTLVMWIDKNTSPTVHILAAHRILREKAEFHGNTESLEILTFLINELLVHACTFSDNFPPLTSGLLSNYQLDNGLEKIHTISTWIEALDGMALLLKSIFRATCTFIVASDIVMEKIVRALDMYEVKLKQLRAEGGLVQEYSHLQAHYRVARIMFHTFGHNDEWRYDGFHSDFRFILERFETIMGRRPASTENTPTLKPTLGWIPALFFVATKCRDHDFRQRALSMLHSVTRNERGWTSCMATTIARFVVEKESQVIVSNLQDHPKSPPSTHFPQRIQLEEVTFSSRSRKIYLAYSVLTKAGRDREGSVTSLPYCPHPSVENDGVTCAMSRKILRHCGYTGIMLFTPQIDCHCVPTHKPVAAAGRKDEVACPDPCQIQHPHLSEESLRSRSLSGQLI